VFKLGQKVRLDVNDPETVKLTNVYLSDEEFAVLASLPAAELCKTRWWVAWAGRLWPSTSSMGASPGWSSQKWNSLLAVPG